MEEGDGPARREVGHMSLNVATAPAQIMELTKALRFSGILEDDENLHRIIAAFYDGRIDQIAVKHVGAICGEGSAAAPPSTARSCFMWCGNFKMRCAGRGHGTPPVMPHND